VLAAFMVILVPEWLDGSGHQSRYGNTVEVPETPALKPIAGYMSARDADGTINKQITPEESSIHAWALQVGSFSQQANAEAMRDKLRALGYASYVDVQRKPDSVIYRVRIGPELDQQHLEKMRKDILKKENIEGMVVHHP